MMNKLVPYTPSPTARWTPAGVDPNLVQELVRLQSGDERLDFGNRVVRPFSKDGVYGNLMTGAYTDMYQHTTSQAYDFTGRASDIFAFHYFNRKNVHGSGFEVMAGTAFFADFLDNLRFELPFVRKMALLTGNDQKPIFRPEFLALLAGIDRFHGDIDMIPEGTLVFPHIPRATIVGSPIMGQLVETPLLNMANFQSLIATKAARICLAADSAPVIDFSFRRDQDLASLGAALASYIGGAVGTSNMAAFHHFDLPPGGTHPHAWVMAHFDELDAFTKFAESQPNNVVLLVDTYNTRLGIENAILVAKYMLARGHKIKGIRLDSGDMALDSQLARRRFDQEGLSFVQIFASNDLDENKIQNLRQNGAAIGVFGVGTQMGTGGKQSSLGGVYKNGLIEVDGIFYTCMKVSNEPIKESIPGLYDVRRLVDANGMFFGDIIFDSAVEFEMPSRMFDPWVRQDWIDVPSGLTAIQLKEPLYRGSQLVLGAALLTPNQARQRRQDQLDRLPSQYKRLDHPDVYPVGLSPNLHHDREEFKRQIRNRSS